MEKEQMLKLLKAAVQESNRSFIMNYLDNNGYPHSSFMGFAHLNSNLSVVLLVRAGARKVESFKTRPRIQLMFHTRDRSHYVKLFGDVLVDQSPPHVRKMMAAYPFLSEWFDPSGEDAVVVQLMTEVVEIEVMREWGPPICFEIRDGKPLPIDPDELAAGGRQNQSFAEIRTRITRLHGEMLDGVVNNDFDRYASHYSPHFTAPAGQSLEKYYNALWKWYKQVSLDGASVHWGLRDVGIRDDGTFSCRYYLEIVPKGGSGQRMEQHEIWGKEGGEWRLVRIENN